MLCFVNLHLLLCVRKSHAWLLMAGPIPLMTGSELFRQGPRPMAMSLAGVTNWLCTTLIAVSFSLIQVRVGVCRCVLVC